MKNYTLLIIIILFAFNSTAQISYSDSIIDWNKVTDLVVDETTTYFENIDLLHEIDREIFDPSIKDKEFVITIEDFLLAYWIGYVDGGINSLNQGSFNFHILLSNLEEKKKAAISHRNYLQIKNKLNQ